MIGRRLKPKIHFVANLVRAHYTACGLSAFRKHRATNRMLVTCKRCRRTEAFGSKPDDCGKQI